MRAKVGKIGMATLAGSALIAGPLVTTACSTGPTYDQWAATDGAAGRINLDDVQEAFKLAKSATDFEKRVNQIFEGDGLVLIRAKQDGTALVLEGYEDLNSNFEIDDSHDDLLFSILQNNNSNELRGHGTNSYYHNSFGAGNFLFAYMMVSAISPRGYYYSTPSRSARTTLRQNRTSYRNTSFYKSQVSKNSSYFNRQRSFAGSRYSSASRNVSTARQSYQSSQKTSGSFKRSNTGVRNSWGASSRSRAFSGGSRGGFRGGGGSQTIIGNFS